MHRRISSLSLRVLATAGFTATGAFAAEPPPTSPVATTATTTPVVELEEYIVNASPFARTADELGQPVSVLAGPTLDHRRAPSLGETLDGSPGVASTYFGPGASRPIIRGLGGERIRVLTNGLGAIDVSANSPDHAVSLDPALTERIEVVRGPATLLYGSSAAGGVVNVIDHQVPSERAEATVAGFAEFAYGSNADAKTAALHLDGGANDLAWQVSLSRRRSGDVDIPGFAENDEHGEGEESDEDEHVRGVLPNSAIRTTSGSGGLSWFWDRGFTGAAFTTLDTRYGVPGHEHHDDEGDGDGEAAEEEGAVQIDLKQRRLDLRSEITEPFGPFRSGRLRAGFADYEHVELEGDEIGTRFQNRGYEARLDLVHLPVGGFEGAVGLQVQHNRLEAEGEEAFLPPTRTWSRAIFAMEELPQGALRWQLGARLEAQDVAVRDGSEVSRDKDALSVSAGTIWELSKAWTLAASLARTERIPTAQEMFANGPHVATAAFEIGDPDLGKETSTAFDVSLRRRTGPITGAVSVFVNDVDRFIFEDHTGEEEDGLAVYRYVARDARFHGAELEATWHLHEHGGQGFDVTLSSDFVRAEDRRNDTPLPRIPPFRVGLAFDYRNKAWSAGVAWRQVARQSRTAPEETATAGYELLSAYASWSVSLGEAALEWFVRGSNLLDEEARPHTSFLKDVAPLPGRNVTIGARIVF